MAYTCGLVFNTTMITNNKHSRTQQIHDSDETSSHMIRYNTTLKKYISEGMRWLLSGHLDSHFPSWKPSVVWARTIRSLVEMVYTSIQTLTLDSGL